MCPIYITVLLHSNFGCAECLERYPYIATEVLCSDIWSIVETCVGNSTILLTPFWDTVLDTNPEDLKAQNPMASQFMKINSMFLGRKPTEVRQKTGI